MIYIINKIKMFAQKLKKLNYSTELDSLKIKIKEITNWASLHNIKININIDDLNKNCDWIYTLIPESYEEQEKFFLKNGTLDNHKRVVIYHCLQELCVNNYRTWFFEKLMRGKEKGWTGCKRINKSFAPDKLQETNISYYSKFTLQEFYAVGI